MQFFFILAIGCKLGDILFKGKKDSKMVPKMPVQKNGSTGKFGYCKIAIGSSVAKGEASAPPLACRPKCRIRKKQVFSTFETVVCTGMD